MQPLRRSWSGARSGPRGLEGRVTIHITLVCSCAALFSPQITISCFFFVFYAFKVYVAYGFFCSWKKPWTEEPGRSPVGRSPRCRTESDTTERLPFPFSLSRLGEGHGNPPQCSCLENPRDGGARRATVYGVAQIRT